MRLHPAYIIRLIERTAVGTTASKILQVKVNNVSLLVDNMGQVVTTDCSSREVKAHSN